jgi:enoyl-CoA hydratase/carnithine racemase
VPEAAGLRVVVDGSVARLTLDRPERRNAQTPALWRRLAAVPDELPADVRVVVLRAEGPSFSAGLDRRMLAPGGVPGEPDLAAMATLSDDELDATIAGFQSAFSWLRGPAFVSVAAVQGHAVGAGFQLALACDLMVVADDVQLAIREPSLGLVPDLGGTQPLVQALGHGRALALCLTGRWLGPDEALASGLAVRVAPRADLDAVVDDLVAAVLGVAPGAARATKALLRAAAERSFDAQLAAERAAQAERLRDLLPGRTGDGRRG